MLAKLSRGNQVTLPKKIVEQAHLKAGQDYVDVEYVGGLIHLKPVDVEERLPPETYERLLTDAFVKSEGDVLIRENEAATFLSKRAKKRRAR